MKRGPPAPARVKDAARRCAAGPEGRSLTRAGAGGGGWAWRARGARPGFLTEGRSWDSVRAADSPSTASRSPSPSLRDGEEMLRAVVSAAASLRPLLT